MNNKPGGTPTLILLKCHINRRSSQEKKPFENDQFKTWLYALASGVATATNDAFGAQVTMAKELEHSTGKHCHEMTFQMINVLNGWINF